MRKVEALRDKKQKVLQTQQGSEGTGSSPGVLEEKHTSNGQAQRINAQPLIPEKYGRDKLYKNYIKHLGEH